VTGWDVHRLQGSPSAFGQRLHDTPHGRGITPHVHVTGGRAWDPYPCREIRERHVPFVAPDLHVQVCNVAVDLQEIVQRVSDPERPVFVGRRVVPHDPYEVVLLLHSEGPWGSGASDLGRRSRRVLGRSFAHPDAVDLFPLAQWDLAVSTGERSREAVSELFVDVDRSRIVHSDVDVGTPHEETLRLRLSAPEDRQRDPDQKCPCDDPAHVR
jgi:hypothetical protein